MYLLQFPKLMLVISIQSEFQTLKFRAVNISQCVNYAYNLYETSTAQLHVSNIPYGVLDNVVDIPIPEPEHTKAL